MAATWSSEGSNSVRHEVCSLGVEWAQKGEKMTAAVVSEPAQEVKKPRRGKAPYTGLPRVYFILPAAIFTLFIIGYPMFELVRMSFANVVPATLLTGGEYVGFDNYTELFTSPNFAQIAGRTAIFGLIVLAIGLPGGLAAALALEKKNRYFGFTYGLMVLMWALPPIVNAVAWRFIFFQDGALNEILTGIGILPEPVFWLIDGWLPLLSVSFVAGWVALPFAAVVFRAALLDVPKEQLEAAEVDGAGAWSRFWNVTFPSISPTVYILSILFLSWAVRSFDFAFIMTGGGPGEASTTLPLLGYIRAFQLADFSGGATVAVITIVAVLLFALPYTRSLGRQER
jgi:multiple sugar transport system permease protein